MDEGVFREEFKQHLEQTLSPFSSVPHKLASGLVPSLCSPPSYASIMWAANIILAADIILLPNLSGRRDLVLGCSIVEVFFLSLLFLEMAYNSLFFSPTFSPRCLGEMSPFLSLHKDY